MLRKYFYKKLLDLHLCKYTLLTCLQDNPEKERHYWESELRDANSKITTVRQICGELFGCRATGYEISREARNDANTLHENKVYWIPCENSEINEYKERYKESAEISAILDKLI